MNDNKRLSHIRRELESKLGDDAHHITDWGIEHIAHYTGIPLDHIEDDESITEEPQTGWIEEMEQRRTTERAERQQQRTEYTLARADLGGSHRIAAALARNGGKA